VKQVCFETFANLLKIKKQKLLLEGSPLSTEQCWSSVRVTIGFLVTSLTNAPVAQSGRAASSRKSRGGSKLLPFLYDGSHC